MAIGALGFGGAALPASGELALAAGVAVVGVALAIGGQASKWAAGSLVALLGLLHGQAHAAELPSITNAIGYLTASAVLLLAGRLAVRPWQPPRLNHLS
jgi:urease accessory protein